MFHKEGYGIILITLSILIVGVISAHHFIDNRFYQKLTQIILLVMSLLVIQFFRNPARHTVPDAHHIISAVDGKVVAIEEVYEPEYFKDKRIQLSVFMSPLNVHVTRYPISGKVVYSQYHPGKYLIASYPKSSTLNERTSIVVANETVGEILYRQIAGTVARRIVNYAKVGDFAVQGEDAGFIKFGSRVDIFLPLHAKINVKIGDKVRGGEQVLAIINP